jgi:hypothetical protein
MLQYPLSDAKIRLLFKALQYKRRCGRCQESVKYAVRGRFQEIMCPIPTGIPEENGMRISRL